MSTKPVFKISKNHRHSDHQIPVGWETLISWTCHTAVDMLAVLCIFILLEIVPQEFPSESVQKIIIFPVIYLSINQLQGFNKGFNKRLYPQVVFCGMSSAPPQFAQSRV